MSKPFVAGMESMAYASMASSLSKHGSPSPAGTPLRATYANYTQSLLLSLLFIGAVSFLSHFIYNSCRFVYLVWVDV